MFKSESALVCIHLFDNSYKPSFTVAGKKLYILRVYASVSFVTFHVIMRRRWAGGKLPQNF